MENIKLPHDKNGRFLKGFNYSPETQFKKGQHWRITKVFWDKKWLQDKYEKHKKSSAEIAKNFGVTDNTILFWLKKFNIKRRTMSETRKIKRWGAKNENNPSWKGENAKYQALHGWIRRNLIKELYCEKCKIKGKFIMTKSGERWNLDWANLSGKFLRDRKDWKCLCRKCHREYDKTKLI